LTLEVFGPPDGGFLPFSEYSEEWPRRYETERATITAALGDVILQIEHIGSTSVPGLAAKPIIDILVAVPNIDNEPAYRPLLEDAGYVLRVREPGHRMFRTPERDVHVHLYTAGVPEIDADLLFRDWIREHAEDRARYEALKRELITREWDRMQDYADAKGPLIEEIKARAAGRRRPA
jgi:GrpB-like predicted nucleotidyltransferase (UPF0157 family)